MPEAIFDDLALEEGAFVEVSLHATDIVIEPKRVVAMEDSLSPEEEKLVEVGSEQLKNGKRVPWDNLGHELDL